MFGGSRSGLGYVVAGIILVGYAVVGCVAEADYLVAGRDGHANVTAAREVCRARHGLFRPRCYQEVHIAFTEPNGTQRTATGRRPAGSRSSGARVPIRYTPGKNGRVRFADDVDWPAVILGAGFAAVGAFAAARFAARGGFRSVV